MSKITTLGQSENYEAYYSYQDDSEAPPELKDKRTAYYNCTDKESFAQIFKLEGDQQLADRLTAHFENWQNEIFMHSSILRIKEASQSTICHLDKETKKIFYVVSDKFETTCGIMKEKGQLMSFKLILNVAKGLMYLHKKGYTFGDEKLLIDSIVCSGDRAWIYPFFAKKDNRDSSKQNDVASLLRILEESAKGKKLQASFKVYEPLEKLLQTKYWKLPIRTIYVILSGLETNEGDFLIENEENVKDDFIKFTEEVGAVMKEMLDMTGVLEVCQNNGFYSYLLGLLNILHLLNFEANIIEALNFNEPISEGSKEEDTLTNHLVLQNGKLIVFEGDLQNKMEQEILRFQRKLKGWMDRPRSQKVQFAEDLKAVGEYADFKKQILSDLKAWLSQQRSEQANTRDISEKKLAQALGFLQGEFNADRDAQFLEELSKVVLRQRLESAKNSTEGHEENRGLSYRFKLQFLKFCGFMQLSRKMTVSDKRKKQFQHILKLLKDPNNEEEVDAAFRRIVESINYEPS